MAFQDHFSARAQGYRAARPAYPEVVADYFADIAPRRGTAWEVGCGSGQQTVLLAERFAHVVATDPSTAQLAHAPRRPAITYHCALAEVSALRDHCADLAIAAQAAHWFELDRFYAEARRVLRADGVVALACYGTTIVDDDVDPVILEFHNLLHTGYWPPERRHVDAGYRTLPFPFDALPTPDLEMRTEWTVAEMLAYVDSWSGVHALLKAGQGARLERFHDALRTAWGEGVRTVHWPLAIKAGRIS